MKNLFRNLIDRFSAKSDENIVIEPVENQELETVDGARNYGWRGGGWNGGGGFYS